MGLKLMYITNRPKIAQVAETAGVDRIFVDMEYIGKSQRQGGMDTVQSNHTLEDVKNISQATDKAEVLVRINPIHEATEGYTSSKEEIDGAIANGASILMLPYFKTSDEVRKFVDLVDGRVKIIPLVETPEAVEIIDDILKLDIDEIFIGLNDLSLGYGKKFMFELLSDGTVEKITDRIKCKDIPFGFGGLASLNGGLLPGRMVLQEHYRLGSSSVILSRTFCNMNHQTDLSEIEKIFINGVAEIRNYEQELLCMDEYIINKENVRKAVKTIVEG